MIAFDLQTVLIIVIILITINLLIVGGYIVAVLRDIKRTINRAEEVIDDVDMSVKDGIEKAKAMEAPLQAIATTSAALTGVIKGADAVKRMTQSILPQKTFEDPAKTKKPRFFRKKK